MERSQIEKRTRKSYPIPECQIRIRVPSLFKGIDAEDWSDILSKHLVNDGVTTSAPIDDESVRFTSINDQTWYKIEEAVKEWSKENGFKMQHVIIELSPADQKSRYRVIINA